VLVLGALFLLLAGRQWRTRPAPGSDPPLPKWMAGIDVLTPIKAFGLGVLLAGVNPKNLVLTIGAAAGLCPARPLEQRRCRCVVYYLLDGDKTKAALDELKGWLGVHNAAVMAVLFIVFGFDLIAKGNPPLT
jgi:hypothetical protein